MHNKGREPGTFHDHPLLPHAVAIRRESERDERGRGQFYLSEGVVLPIVQIALQRVGLMFAKRGRRGIVAFSVLVSLSDDVPAFYHITVLHQVR